MKELLRILVALKNLPNSGTVIVGMSVATAFLHVVGKLIVIVKDTI